MTTIRSLVTLAALALMAAAPGAASAQSTLNGETTLYACYVPKSGTVYRIKVEGTPSKCAQNHVAFSWTTGGTSSSVEIVEVSPVQYILAGGDFLQKEMECPEGTIAVSGGFYAHSELVQVDASIRAFSKPNAWFFQVRHTGAVGSPTGSSVTLSVLCLKS
jgi:hypothetical protein